MFRIKKFIPALDSLIFLGEMRIYSRLVFYFDDFHIQRVFNGFIEKLQYEITLFLMGMALFKEPIPFIFFKLHYISSEKDMQFLSYVEQQIEKYMSQFKNLQILYYPNSIVTFFSLIRKKPNY